jgi:hypothetical protein
MDTWIVLSVEEIKGLPTALLDSYQSQLSNFRWIAASAVVCAIKLYQMKRYQSAVARGLVDGIKHRPRGLSNNAGNKTKSPRMELPIIAIIKHANCFVGTKSENMNGSIERQLINMV